MTEGITFSAIEGVCTLCANEDAEVDKRGKLTDGWLTVDIRTGFSVHQIKFSTSM
jgi:hypothetical protein